MSGTADSQSIESGAWTLDPAHSSVEFRTKTFWGAMPVSGHFSRYSGRLDLSANPAIQLTIESGSLDTGLGPRDKHLRSADFFDVEHHPEVTFTATEVTAHGDHVHVRGTLAAAGREMPLEPAVSLRHVDGHLEIEAVVEVEQKALGMTYSMGGMVRPTSRLTVKGRLIPVDG